MLVIAAVVLPNVVSWRYRLRFSLGRFEYEKGGNHGYYATYDFTHSLRAENFWRSNVFLISTATVEGIFPLARKIKLLSQIVGSWIDL